MSILESAYPLSPEQRDAYTRDGHIYLPGLISADDLAPYREAILRTSGRLNQESRPLEERDTYGKAFLQTTNLWRHDETVAAFVLAKRFARIAADLMGVEAVRLYHDQSLFKEPGGGLTPWHQDQQYWPLDSDKTITLWMPLVDVPETMGTMYFASGSHAEGYLGHLPISDGSEALIQNLIREKGYTVSPPRAMAAGDATFHSGWCLHGAPGNPGSYTREVMTIIYYADGLTVGSVDSQDRANDLAAWFPGLKSGDVAASELNPRLG
jgi:ectoine hydroxylase-related dioxygenase (phytanoyl-CoA dioxygenase family)